MKKEDVLKQAQTENKGKDMADLEAQKNGARTAYIVGILLMVTVNLVENLVYSRISYGGTMVVFAMGFTAFLHKYITLRKRHELVVTLLFGMCTAIYLVLWILRMCGAVA